MEQTFQSIAGKLVTTEMINNKMGGDVTEEAIRILLNKCLYQEKIPKAWQNAEVILLRVEGRYRKYGQLSKTIKLH